MDIYISSVVPFQLEDYYNIFHIYLRYVKALQFCIFETNYLPTTLQKRALYKQNVWFRQIFTKSKLLKTNKSIAQQVFYD